MNWEKLYNSFCTGATMVKQGIFIGFSTHASSVLVLALGSYLRLFVLLLWVLLLLSCCLFCCFFSQLNISSGELCGNPSCTVRLGEGVPEEDWIKWPQKTSCRRKQQQSFNFSVVHFSVTYFSKLSLSFFFSLEHFCKLVQESSAGQHWFMDAFPAQFTVWTGHTIVNS